MKTKSLWEGQNVKKNCDFPRENLKGFISAGYILQECFKGKWEFIRERIWDK